MPPVRVVFDVNIFVTAVCDEALPFLRERLVRVPPLNGNAGVLAVSIVLKGIEDGVFPCELFVSDHILVNVIHVLKRRYNWPIEDLVDYGGFLRDLAEGSGGDAGFRPTSQITDCEDFEDRKILALAKDAEAHLLVTEDTALLHLSPWKGIPIIRASEFGMRANDFRRRVAQTGPPRPWLLRAHDPGLRE